MGELAAAGKPVIGVAEGGVLETVVPGETGLLVPADPPAEAIAAAGRVLDSRLSNENFIVLNESALTAMHFESADDALGQELIMQDDSSRRVIIGVVKNYNHEMLMEKLTPMALIYNPEEFRMLQETYTGTFQGAGKTVERVWSEINPALKVDYKDFAAEVHKLYDILFGDLVSLLSVIAVLAILISCLGLLGMATYATETRIKEISIRKVLGSSNGALVYLLSKGFGGPGPQLGRHPGPQQVRLRPCLGTLPS